MFEKMKKRKIEFDFLENSFRGIWQSSILTYFSEYRDIEWRIDTWRSRILRITHFTMNLATRRLALHTRDRVVMRSPTGIFERCHTSSSCVSITSEVTWRWIKYHTWFSADLCVLETLPFFSTSKCCRYVSAKDN